MYCVRRGCGWVGGWLTRETPPRYLGGYSEMRIDEEFFKPGVADATRIGGAIDARTPKLPVRKDFGGSTAGGDVEVFAVRQCRGFFDGDEVVFETEVSIDVGFVLVVAGDDA